MQVSATLAPREATTFRSKALAALLGALPSVPARAQAIHSDLSVVGALFSLVLPVGLIVAILCILQFKLRRSVLVGRLLTIFAICILFVIVLALANPFAALLLALLPWPFAVITIFLAFWDDASRKDAARRERLAPK
jgi:hypothetical protein